MLLPQLNDTGYPIGDTSTYNASGTSNSYIVTGLKANSIYNITVQVRAWGLSSYLGMALCDMAAGVCLHHPSRTVCNRL